jgi:hypothetical protein
MHPSFDPNDPLTMTDFQTEIMHTYTIHWRKKCAEKPGRSAG